MRRLILVCAAVLGMLGLLALGVWQLERREWKRALIERVEQRVHAAPVATPGPADWSALTRENAEYLHVTATGRFLEGRETLVHAVTARGRGYWVIAPLRTDRGFIVLVNRGFVPPERRDTPTRPDGDGKVAIPGLVRMTEPGGAFLQANAPRDNRWYSRDVAVIAHAQGLGDVAPYFIDADAGPDSDSLPMGGLTVIAFHNSHLVYAITWFTLALMVAVFGLRIACSGPAGAHAAFAPTGSSRRAHSLN